MKTFERAGDMKMRPRHWLVLLMVIGIASGPAYALTVGDAIVAIADNVSESQQQDGSWHLEEAYTGSIITGLLSAARQNGLPPNDPKYQTYLSSARLGGFYLVEAAQGFYFGEEVFALSDSQEITYFRGLAARFFQRAKEVDTTPGYIAAFDDLGPSTLVQGLAWYVIAAWETDAADKWIWRQALIDALAQVDDETAAVPVMALGAATWGLGKIGGLDDTLVDSTGGGRPMWQGVTTADLPSLLMDHQVPQDQFDAGTFYWRFDHSDGGADIVPAGYVEDTVFSTLGLLTHHDTLLADPDHDPEELALLAGALLDATKAILASLPEDGQVREHLTLGGLHLNAYGGEMLYLLDQLNLDPDLEIGDLDSETDFAGMRRAP
ncbi:MAG: hypothetical protein IIC50_17990 [Planctomycetes bacterium]|nr:hypothetical protein [Planctomycetota bacterium]